MMLYTPCNLHIYILDSTHILYRHVWGCVQRAILALKSWFSGQCKRAGPVFLNFIIKNMCMREVYSINCASFDMSLQYSLPPPPGPHAILLTAVYKDYHASTTCYVAFQIWCVCCDKLIKVAFDFSHNI
jgi:hypothetical protein